MHNVNSIEEKVVAILHDVVEDSNITFEDLERKGISSNCIDALKLLTHKKDVAYMDYIADISNNKIATKVKIADLRDNCDTSRLSEITRKDEERIKKYHIAIAYLDNKLANNSNYNILVYNPPLKIGLGGLF